MTWVAMRDGLNDRGRAILEEIRRSVKERGYPPTLRELCAATGVAAPSQMQRYLVALQREGYIRRDSSSPRAITVLKPSDGRA